ncbi:MAG: hypothetical protein CMM52_01390 [Rhodospirillaceae bacterium]|nr:hypothetical protein [Rhodospirillaceae bacterium]|tara:strand:+ start:29015 stop:29761 length:747 start_codon:yes stop_codon:yes gene_type:complete
MKVVTRLPALVILVFSAVSPTAAQQNSPRPIYCENNGFAVLADEIDKARRASVAPALIAAAKRRYERARRWRMRARAAECEGLLRNALNDLRQARSGKRSDATNIKCDAESLDRLAQQIGVGRKAKLNHALIRSVQSRYLMSKKLLAQKKLEICARQIATGLRTLKKAHEAKAAKAKVLASGVGCNDSGFSTLNAEMRTARIADLNPSAISAAKSHYRKARRSRRKKDHSACAEQLNAGLKAIQSARK